MLISLDVGFRTTGWAVFNKGNIIDVGVTETERSTKKNVRVADDKVNRASILADGLYGIITRHKCQGIIGELPSGGSQSSRAANCMGIAMGVAGALVATTALPAEWCTPTDVKKAITGKRSASKEEIMNTVAEMYNWHHEKIGRAYLYYMAFNGEIAAFSKGWFEHIADAIGAYHALKHDNLVKMFG